MTHIITTWIKQHLMGFALYSFLWGGILIYILLNGVHFLFFLWMILLYIASIALMAKSEANARGESQPKDKLIVFKYLYSKKQEKILLKLSLAIFLTTLASLLGFIVIKVGRPVYEVVLIIVLCTVFFLAAKMLPSFKILQRSFSLKLFLGVAVLCGFFIIVAFVSYKFGIDLTHLIF